MASNIIISFILALPKSSSMGLRLDYNAPVSLTFTIICVAVFILNTVLGGALTQFITLSPPFHFNRMTDYLSLFTYTVGHSSVEHLLGNFTLFLLIGPVIEEKYGSQKLMIMMAVTALITAILNLCFFSTGLMGASGLVFMLIVLASFANAKEGHIPVTFIAILALYLGREVYDIFKSDHISHSAHLIGGFCGGLFGLTKWFK